MRGGMPFLDLCGTSRCAGFEDEDEASWYGGGGSFGSIVSCLLACFLFPFLDVDWNLVRWVRSEE
jgi:hypothetical protein